MYGLPEKKTKRGLAWGQMLPSCQYSGCNSSRGLASMWSRMSGYQLNDDGWYCCCDCLEAALGQQLSAHFHLEPRPQPVRTTMPMGLMLLARGAITDPQLREALRMQQSTGDRIGACLKRLGLIGEEEIASVVATQWGCPVFPAESVEPACSLLLPFSLVERYRMLPVHLVSQGRRLFVAFCERVNHSALMAVEQMLGCETEACIVLEPKFRQMLDFRKQDMAGEVTLHRPASAQETARIICSYAQQTGAEALRLRAVEGNIWARLMPGNSHLDLVFEQLPS